MNDLIKKIIGILMEADSTALNELYSFVEEYVERRNNADVVAPVQPEDAYREAIIALISCNDDPEYLQAVYSFANAYPHDIAPEEQSENPELILRFARRLLN